MVMIGATGPSCLTTCAADSFMVVRSCTVACRAAPGWCLQLVLADFWDKEVKLPSAYIPFRPWRQHSVFGTDCLSGLAALSLFQSAGSQAGQHPPTARPAF